VGRDDALGGCKLGGVEQVPGDRDGKIKALLSALCPQMFAI
jgi:hypothetical protein